MRRQFWLGAASTGLLAIAATGGGVPQARADMHSEEGAGASASGSVAITAGRTALVGGWRVGVSSVADKKAGLVVAAYPAGVPAEFSMQAVEHDLVPTGDGLHRVLFISAASGGKQKGQVSIASMPNTQAGGAAVYLVGDGWLRVNGPDTHGASDIQATKWNPSPASVDVQWRPSQFAVQDTDPRDIQHAHLTVGSALDIGGSVLTVSAIEAQTADHPAWVRFEMVGASRPR
jgi:hypothetical protein